MFQGWTQVVPGLRGGTSGGVLRDESGRFFEGTLTAPTGPPRPALGLLNLVGPSLGASQRERHRGTEVRGTLTMLQEFLDARQAAAVQWVSLES